MDAAKDAVDFSDVPGKYLESKAEQVIKSAREEYGDLTNDLKKTAEESSSDLIERVKDLYEKARKSLCGGEDADDKDPRKSDPDPGLLKCHRLHPRTSEFTAWIRALMYPYPNANDCRLLGSSA